MNTNPKLPIDEDLELCGTEKVRCESVRNVRDVRDVRRAKCGE